MKLLFTRCGSNRAPTAAILFLLLLLAGCSNIRQDYPAPPSQAFDRPQDTTLGRAYAREQARHPEYSGFEVINNGVFALMTRATLADLAERSIDVQYYIYNADECGALLLERLIAAAQRGVRVRVLLDDFAVALDDLTLAKIDAYPNLEVRVFNPFHDRSRLFRAWEMLVDSDRLKMRMHNKVFIADNQVAILGGRNIGNHYFEGQATSNFRDMDVLASGPIVREVSKTFDSYWNNPIAVPVAAFDVQPAVRKASKRFEVVLHQSAAAKSGPWAEYARNKAVVVQHLLTGGNKLIWAQSKLMAEPPIPRPPSAVVGSPTPQISRNVDGAKKTANSEIVMEMAYFVPGKRGVEMLSDLTRGGVRVRILTNSLASTDVAAVHVGYSRYREQLLAAGVELYEYRIDATRPAPAQHNLRNNKSDSALHAKAVVLDRRVVWIGSGNVDARSRRINTESGLMIESEALAAQVLAGMERDFLPQQSWRLTLETDPETNMQQIIWNGLQDGQTVRREREPDAGFLRTMGLFFYSIIPGIEEIL